MMSYCTREMTSCCINCVVISYKSTADGLNSQLCITLAGHSIRSVQDGLLVIFIEIFNAFFSKKLFLCEKLFQEYF